MLADRVAMEHEPWHALLEREVSLVGDGHIVFAPADAHRETFQVLQHVSIFQLHITAPIAQQPVA